jgi:hypothetical protein
MVLKMPDPSAAAGTAMVCKALADAHGAALEGIDWQMCSKSLPPNRRTVMATWVVFAGETHTQGLLSEGRGLGTAPGPFTINMPIDNATEAS